MSNCPKSFQKDLPKYTGLSAFFFSSITPIASRCFVSLEYIWPQDKPTQTGKVGTQSTDYLQLAYHWVPPHEFPNSVPRDAQLGKNHKIICLGSVFRLRLLPCNQTLLADSRIQPPTRNLFHSCNSTRPSLRLFLEEAPRFEFGHFQSSSADHSHPQGSETVAAQPSRICQRAQRTRVGPS